MWPEELEDLLCHGCKLGVTQYEKQLSAHVTKEDKERHSIKAHIDSIIDQDFDTLLDQTWKW
jgi:hypothetical protein